MVRLAVQKAILDWSAVDVLSHDDRGESYIKLDRYNFTKVGDVFVLGNMTD